MVSPASSVQVASENWEVEEEAGRGMRKQKKTAWALGFGEALPEKVLRG